MRLYLNNAFSQNMLAADALLEVDRGLAYSTVRAEIVDAADRERFTSAIGHASTIPIVAKLLNLAPETITPSTARPTITLQPGDVLIVAQYVGPRLPEGATTLPEGAHIRFDRVTVIDMVRIREIVRSYRGDDPYFEGARDLVRDLVGVGLDIRD